MSSAGEKTTKRIQTTLNDAKTTSVTKKSSVVSKTETDATKPVAGSTKSLVVPETRESVIFGYSLEKFPIPDSFYASKYINIILRFCFRKSFVFLASCDNNFKN